MMMKMAPAIAFSLMLLLSTAQAQQIDVQRNAPVIMNGVPYPGPGLSLVMPDMVDFLAAFVVTRSKLNAVANLTEKSLVKVIVVDPMTNADADAIASAEIANHQDVLKLQTAIASNTALTDDLELQDINVSTVLAADVLPGGLVLYALG